MTRSAEQRTDRPAAHSDVARIRQQRSDSLARSTDRAPRPSSETMPRPRLPAEMLHLQRTAGNRAVQSLMAPVQRATPADPTAPKTITPGSRGPAVEEAQQHLNRHGAKPALRVDGDFGGRTRTAVRAFQRAHALPPIGTIGPKTWRALQGTARSALPSGATKHPVDEATELFAKGAAMTPPEAQRAKAVLLTLKGDEFRTVLKAASTSGALATMLAKLDLVSILEVFVNLSREVVVTTTRLKPAPDTIATDVARANDIYNPHGIEIERGNHVELSEKATKTLLRSDQSLDEFTTDQATKEELKVVEMNRMKGRIAAYWVPAMTSSRGEAILKAHQKNLGDDRESVVINAGSRAQDTFAHELGHALGLDHDTDPKNLMAGGNIRLTTGKDIDKLTAAQLARLQSSLVMEIGRKGTGQ